MKHLLLLALLCRGVIVLAADATNSPAATKFDEYMAMGVEVAGFTAPYYDEDGDLVAYLFCGRAKVIENGVAEVRDLRIDVYQDGDVFATVYAPKCLMKIVVVDERKVLEVTSEGDVLLDMKEMTISGRGFRFTSENNRFEIQRDAKVLLKEAARAVKGVDL